MDVMNHSVEITFFDPPFPIGFLAPPALRNQTESCGRRPRERQIRSGVILSIRQLMAMIPVLLSRCLRSVRAGTKPRNATCLLAKVWSTCFVSRAHGQLRDVAEKRGASAD